MMLQIALQRRRLQRACGSCKLSTQIDTAAPKAPGTPPAEDVAANDSHLLSWMRQRLHPGLDGVHWVHGNVLGDARQCPRKHVLRAGHVCTVSITLLQTIAQHHSRADLRKMRCLRVLSRHCCRCVLADACRTSVNGNAAATACEASCESTCSSGNTGCPSRAALEDASCFACGSADDADMQRRGVWRS